MSRICFEDFMIFAFRNFNLWLKSKYWSKRNWACQKRPNLFWKHEFIHICVLCPACSVEKVNRRRNPMESILMWLIYPDLRTLLNPFLLLLLLLDPVVIQHNFSRLSTYSVGQLIHPFFQHLRILTFVALLWLRKNIKSKVYYGFASFEKFPFPIYAFKKFYKDRR